MKYLLVALSVLSFPIVGKAQNFYKKSTLVDKRGEVINGFVKYDDWNRNPKVVLFKTSPESKSIKQYHASDLASFSIDDIDYFESAVVAVSMDNVEQTETLTEDPVDTSIVEEVFLRVIAKGDKVDLYSYTDNLKQRFYVRSKHNDTISELIYKRYIKGVTIEKETRYKQQLLVLARGQNKFDDPELIEKLTDIQYVKRDIEQVVAYINGASNQSFPKHKANNFRFYAGAAIAVGQARFVGFHELATGASSAVRFGPKLNFGIDLMQNPLTQRLLIRFNASFDMAKYEISKIMDAKGGSLKYSGSQSTIGLGAQVIYNFYNNEHFSANCGLGITGNYSFNKNSKLVYDYDEPGIIGGSYHKTDKFELESLWVNLPVRAGLLIRRRFDCYVQANLPFTAITNYSYYNVKVTSMQIGMNVLF